MGKKQYLECGKISNTHGLRGEVKLIPWCDSPDFLLDFSRLFLEDAGGHMVEYAVSSARVQKDFLIIQFASVHDVNEAAALKNRTVFLNRDDAQIGEGNWFLQDIIGLPVFTTEGEQIGVLEEILYKPASDVYVVRGEREHLIPAVDAFIKEVDVDGGRIVVSLIEGM